MDFYEAINRRHIVREWKQEDVSEEAVKRHFGWPEGTDKRSYAELGVYPAA